MSFDALLRHSLTILDPATGTEDSHGHVEVYPYADGATVHGLVQERTGREVEGPDLGGAVVVNAVVFLPWGTTINERNRLRRDNGAIYQVLYVKDAAGQSHHLEVDCRRIAP